MAHGCVELSSQVCIRHTHFSYNMFSNRDKGKPSTELRGQLRGLLGGRQPGQTAGSWGRPTAGSPDSYPCPPGKPTSELSGTSTQHAGAWSPRKSDASNRALCQHLYDSHVFCSALPLLLIQILTGRQCRAHVS